MPVPAQNLSGNTASFQMPMQPQRAQAARQELCHVAFIIQPADAGIAVYCIRGRYSAAQMPDVIGTPSTTPNVDATPCAT